mmetsp:Transcript_16723/g.50620  ORF Transcript_16723/g.50620 Transcript_16723/m.50620 type:complete len:255 (+) Transcript_16723:115-879(+)
MGATLSSRAAPTAPRHFLADLNDGLHSAVRKNKFSQATSLLEEGADIYYRAPGPYGRSLLHQALVSQTVRRVRVIDSRRVPLVRLLCERGGLQLINALDNYGVPALRYAITSRCADLVRALLEGGASTKLGRGDTSLFRAVTLREPEIARLLLAHGADANQISRHGAYAFFQSPLVRAVVNNHVAMARILLDWGTRRCNGSVLLWLSLVPYRRGHRDDSEFRLVAHKRRVQQCGARRYYANRDGAAPSGSRGRY